MARWKISRQYRSLDVSLRRYLLISIVHRVSSADKLIWSGSSSISIPIALDPLSVGRSHLKFPTNIHYSLIDVQGYRTSNVEHLKTGQYNIRILLQNGSSCLA